MIKTLLCATTGMLLAMSPQQTVYAQQLCAGIEAVPIMSEYTDKEDYLKAYLDYYIPKEDHPEMLNEVYTGDEILAMTKMIIAEDEEGTFDSMVNVSNVILNRIGHPGFQEDVQGVLKADGQFASNYNGRFKEAEPTGQALDALEYAHCFTDTTGGALYFCSYEDIQDPETKEFFNGLTYLFKDSSDIYYYK